MTAYDTPGTWLVCIIDDRSKTLNGVYAKRQKAKLAMHAVVMLALDIVKPTTKIH